jgi:hypothetical protein
MSMDDGVIRRGRLDVLCLVYDVWGERVEKIWRAFFGFSLGEVNSLGKRISIKKVSRSIIPPSSDTVT